MPSLISELKDFVMKGDIIDLAIAVVIGIAFNNLITAFIGDVITPLIGIPGHVDFSTITYTINSSVFQIGLFINALISFITIAVVLFFFVVKPMAKLQEKIKPKEVKTPPATKQCPECLSTIPAKAKRCAFCTSKVD